MTTAPGPKKILWHSGAPWTPTGYGQQTAMFSPRIRDAGYDVALSAWWGLGGAARPWDDMIVYPGDQLYGNATLKYWADAHQADLVLALMDAWVLNPDAMRELPLAVWTPVDHKPCPPKVAQFFKRSGARTVAMSKFGEEMLVGEGLEPLYVPHAVDTKIFHQRFRDETREMLGVTDGFLVGIVANNSGGMPPASGPPRKAFPQSIMAFANFQRKHPEAVLYLHTEMTGRPGREHGLNIGRLLERFEIPMEAVRFTNPAEMEVGSHPVGMASLYSAMDVLLNPSYGEGFGIPIIEAQACGTPVIVSDWTAMTELCGAGWLVEGEPWYDPSHESFYLCPAVGLILEALEEAYGNAAGLRTRAVEFAQAYDANLVMSNYWLPVLDKLLAPREVPPLPNRAMRRAAQKAAA